jgi:aspartyl-tRNA synthetase
MLRTHTCGELRGADDGKTVSLCGWIRSSRTHGGVLFLDLGDRYGVTQVVLSGSQASSAEKLLQDTVVRVTGEVVKKPYANKKLETGEIEIQVKELEVLNRAEALPIDKNDPNITDESRMKYRYIDLRRPEMQSKLVFRHKAALAVREYFDKENFLEIETPLLIKHTPEGARDYVVPSRLHHGQFYSLPQSPQLYKQILMVAGCDRYVQLARCLRDEDLRSDRQPEFTQIDMEMSFVDENDVFTIIEGMIKHVVKKTQGKDVKIPFERLSYAESMNRFGSDKPDMRFGLELVDVTDILEKTEVRAFKGAESIQCVVATGCASYSRKKIDKLNALAQVHHAKGAFWFKWGAREGPLRKHLSEDILAELEKRLSPGADDLLLICADKFEVAAGALGQLRLKIAADEGMIPEDKLHFAWINEFPLFEWNFDEEKWDAMHHIFCMPKNMDDVKNHPERALGKLYDLVLNGWEMGSGSIRIHRKDIQQDMLNRIGLSYEEAEEKFGFLLNSFKYGAPPHGGFAVGFDRLVAVLLGEKDIREVIAFPKNKKAEGLMEKSPGAIDPRHRKELGL